MKKKIIAVLIAVIAIAIIGGLTAYVFQLQQNLDDQQKENQDMQELARLDKLEMENEYQGFANQYSEMMTKINNDSIIAQLTREQMRTQQLLKELQKAKVTDVSEITRLKKELAEVRAVLREYVITIDSLNRVNESLKAENTTIRGQLDESARQNQALATEKASLSEKVAIAAQLDATAINLTPLNKKGKVAKGTKNWKQLKVDFTIAKNVTAQGGMRTVYVRIATPTGAVLNAGSFTYENRQLQYSMKKTVEYDGQAVAVSTFWNVNEVQTAGTYRVDIFCDGQMIGNKTFSLQ